MNSPGGATRTPRRVCAAATITRTGVRPLLDNTGPGSVEEDGDGRPAPVSPAKAARRRASRRDRSAAADTSGGVDVLSDIDAATAGPQLRRERELELRKSLDSLAIHEHFNLGRLSASKLPQAHGQNGMAVLEGEEESEPVGQEGHEQVGEQSADFAMAAAPTFADDSLNCLSTPLRMIDGTGTAPSHKKESSRSPGPHARVRDGVHSPSVQQSRSQKIDQVQEKINSTIAGLAQIMQGFPSGGQGSTGVIQRGGPKKADTSTVIGGVYGVDARTDGPVTGTVVTLQVYSSWGDEHYVGLNGIELYGPQGHLYALPALGRDVSALGYVQSIVAFPQDLNIIPDTSGDPRRVANLLDGVNFTKNDLHSWLAPQLPFLRLHHPSAAAEVPAGVPDGCLAVITITFDRPVEVAMCRVFNYNRSRARNQRGVRWCKILVEDKQMWDG